MQLKSKDGYILTAIFFWFFLILTPLGVFNEWVPPEINKGFYSVTQIDQGDDAGYYAFLRSLFFDGDIDFFNEKGYAHIENITPTGFVFNNWQIGQGILFFPFFLLGHFLALLLNTFGVPISIDGYSAPYYLSTAIASHTYLFLGLLSLNQLIKRYTTKQIALIAVIAIWLASPLLYYSFIRQRMAHTVEFFMAVLFISAWLKKRESKNHIDHALLGAILGFFCVIRIINISFFALYFIDQLSIIKNNSALEKPYLLKDLFLRYFWVFICFFLVLSPQLLVWQILNGTPLPTRHFEMAGSGLSFLFSNNLLIKFLDVFYSPQWGLFLSFPIFSVSVIGFFSEKKFNAIKIGVLAYFASMVFIVAVYPENSDSYGQRHFISSIPLLALGLVGALNWAMHTSRKKYSLYFFILLCAIWQYILVVEYKTYLVYDDPHYSINAFKKIKTIFSLNPNDFLRSSNIFRVLTTSKTIPWTYEDFLFLIGFPLTQLFILIFTINLFQSSILQIKLKRFFHANSLMNGLLFFSLTLFAYFLITIEKLPYEEQKRRKDFQGLISKTRNSVNKLDFTTAIQLGNQSNKIYPNHWAPHILIGLSWQSLGKQEKALESYKLALKQNPENFFALGHIGEIYIQQAKWELAKTYLLKARAISPNSSKIYNYLGQAEGKIKNLDKAEEMFLTATKLEGQFGEFHANLAIIYFLKKDHKKALKHLIQAKFLGYESDITKKILASYGVQITKEKNK